MNLNHKTINQFNSQRSSNSEYLEYNNHIKDRIQNKNPLISIILPLYNEEKSVKNVIDLIPNDIDHEVILVDDGSTDESIENVKKVNNKYIKIIKHEQNKGYGAALLTGFNYASGDIIVTIDSDGQHNPKEIPNIIEPIINKNADMVIGSRYLGETLYPIPLHIKIGEYFIKKALRLLYNQEICNNQSGFRAFHKSILAQFGEFYDYGMVFSTELLLKTLEIQKKIIEVPISLKPRIYGTSYVKLARILIKILTCVTIYGLRKFKTLRKVLDKCI